MAKTDVDKYIDDSVRNIYNGVSDNVTLKKEFGLTREIIENISYKGANVKTPMKTLEGEIVQDADRLDALGAVGIARTFAYGAYAKQEIYNPEIKPKMHSTYEEYKNSQGDIPLYGYYVTIQTSL